jgi:hypothetical protein
MIGAISPIGTFQTCRQAGLMSASGAKADIVSAGYGRTDIAGALPWPRRAKHQNPPPVLPDESIAARKNISISERKKL